VADGAGVASCASTGNARSRRRVAAVGRCIVVLRRWQRT
jgi:hypothetical protein